MAIPIYQVKRRTISYLAETNKDTAHGLEVKGLVTVEHQDETAELVTQSLH